MVRARLRAARKLLLGMTATASHRRAAITLHNPDPNEAHELAERPNLVPLRPRRFRRRVRSTHGPLLSRLDLAAAQLRWALLLRDHLRQLAAAVA